MKRTFRIVLMGIAILAMVCMLKGEADAGERSNIRGMGMARTSVASARGLDAIGINPANLGLPDDGMVTLSVMPFGLHVGSDFLDYEIYTSYFTGVETDSGRVGKYLTESDKERILESFEDRIARSSFDLDARLLGVSFRIEKLGAAAFTVTDQIGGLLDVPKDYVEFLLKGNPVGSTYSFSGTDVKALWTREYALAIGFPLQRVRFVQSLSVGLAAKLVHGFGYFEVQRFNTFLATSNNATLTGSIDFLSRRAGEDPSKIRYLKNYNIFPELAGKGFGVDIGVAGFVNDALLFGLSVTDIGSIRWSKNTEESFIDTTIVVDDPLNEQQRSMVEDIVRGEKRASGPFSTQLPTTLRAGFAVLLHKLPSLEEMPGEMILELNYTQGFFDTPGTVKIPRISIGLEYKPVSWLPLRTGVSFGGVDYLNLALGFGINVGVFEFALASENVTWLLLPNSFSRGSIAVGTRFRI